MGREIRPWVCYTNRMSKSDDYTNVILEDINSKFDVIADAVGQVQKKMKDLAKQTDLEEVRADVKTIKAAVTQTKASSWTVTSNASLL